MCSPFGSQGFQVGFWSSTHLLIPAFVELSTFRFVSFSAASPASLRHAGSPPSVHSLEGRTLLLTQVIACFEAHVAAERSKSYNALPSHPAMCAAGDGKRGYVFLRVTSECSGKNGFGLSPSTCTGQSAIV